MGRRYCPHDHNDDDHHILMMMMIRETRRLGEQQREMAGKARDSFAQSSLQVSQLMMIMVMVKMMIMVVIMLMIMMVWRRRSSLDIILMI